MGVFKSFSILNNFWIILSEEAYFTFNIWTFFRVVEANFDFMFADFHILLMGIENIGTSFFRNLFRSTSIYLSFLGLKLRSGNIVCKFCELSDLFLVCDVAMSEYFARLSYLILNRVGINLGLFTLHALQVV